MPTPQSQNLDLSPESIRAKLTEINSNIEATLPGILAGIDAADTNNGEKIGNIKSLLPQSTLPNANKFQSGIAGDTIIGPNNILKQSGFNTGFDYAKTLSDNLNAITSSQRDPMFYAKPTSFNASKFGHNYDRYYSHPNFKKLGFNVYRDNEGTYNANSSWFDDFLRMGSKWPKLFYQGGAGLFKNWGEFGLEGASRDAAAMEHDLSVAQSSKEGFGAWSTNFLSNSAYTLGIVGEMVLEEAALSAASAITKSPQLAALTATRGASNLNKLSRSMSIMSKTLGNADKSRTFWKAAVGAGKSFMPFRETIDFGFDLANPNSAVNRLTDAAKAAKGFGSFYRGMKEINAVTAESRLEGGFVQNEVARKNLEEFISTNGRNPNAEEAEAISKNAIEAGVATTLGNIGPIFVSNRIVLDGALKGFKPINRLMNPAAIKSPLFKIIENANWKKTGQNPYELAKSGLFNSAKRVFSKEYLKSIPQGFTKKATLAGVASTAGKGLRYLNANLMEGLQESYQEALQAGLVDYYSDIYRDPSLATKNNLWGSLQEGISQQFSKQGLDVFLSGFLMGGVMGPLQTAILNPAQAATQRVGDYLNKTDNYAQFQKSEKERMEKYVDTLNHVSKNASQYAKWLDENTKVQRDLMEEYEDAELAGDKKSAEDIKQESLFSHVYTLLQAGKYDIFMDQLEGLKDLTDDELAEAFGTSVDKDNYNKDVRGRLDNAIKKANQVKNRFEKVQDIKNIFNPNLFDKERNPLNYERERLGYEAFEKAKFMLAFNEYSFDRALDRIESLTSEAILEGPLGSVAAMDFHVLYGMEGFGGQKGQVDEFIKTLKTEASALKDGTADGEKLSQSKLKQAESLQELRTMMFNYRAMLSIINRSKMDPAAKDKLKEFAEQLNDKYTIIDEQADGQLSFDFESNQITAEALVDAYHKDMFFEAYKKYTKIIAENNNVFVKDFEVGNSFEKLVDFNKLGLDAQNIASYVNILNDPMSMIKITERIQNAQEQREKNSRKLHEEALTKFMSMQNLDELFNKLLEMKVYFDPEFIDEFINEGKLPKQFIDAGNGSVITSADPRYQQIIDLIDRLETERGVTFSGKPKAAAKPKPTPAPSEPTETPAAETKDALEEEESKEETKATVNNEFSDLSDETKAALVKAHEAAMAKYPETSKDITQWMIDSPKAQIIIKSGRAVASYTSKVSEDSVNEISKDNPKSIVDPTPDLQPLFDETWTLVEGLGYVSSKDPSKIASRVSSLVDKKIPDTREIKLAQLRGNLIDNILRSFATPANAISVDGVRLPVPPSLVGENLSPKDNILNAIASKDQALKAEEIKILKKQVKASTDAFEKQFGLKVTDGFVDDMTNLLVELAKELKDYTWYPATPAVSGTINDKLVAGTMDLLIEKDGKYYIIDFKSSTQLRRGKDYYEESDAVQQNAYAELLRQQTGINVTSINILSFLVKANNDRTVLQGVQLDTHKNAKEKITIFTKIPKQDVGALVHKLNGTKPKTKAAAPEKETVEVIDLGQEMKDKGDSFNNINSKIADIEKRRKESYNYGIEELAMDDVPDGMSGPFTGRYFTDFIESINSYNYENIYGTSEKDVFEKINTKYNAEQAALDSEEETKEPVVETKPKAAVPARFKGKTIYAQPGTVDPEIFEKYDVLNADDILKDVMASMGTSVPSDSTVTQAAYNSDKRDEIYSNFIAKIKELNKQGKTVISSNYIVNKENVADVTSSPSPDKAMFFDETGENSVDKFNEWLNKSRLRKENYDFTQEEGWESNTGSKTLNHEVRTNKTVAELFAMKNIPSNFVTNMVKANSVDTLLDIVTLYFKNPEAREKFFTTDSSSTKVPVTGKDILAIFNKRLEQLKRANNLSQDEINKANQMINDLVSEAKAKAVVEPIITKEEKEQAKDVMSQSIKSSISAEDAQKISEEARAATQKEVDDEFNSSLGC